MLQTNGALISSYQARYRFSSYSVGDRVACNIFFPWEFLRPLLKGGTVYVIPDDVVFAPRALTGFIAEHRIADVLFTPSLLQGVLNSASPEQLRTRLSSLRAVWLNGEVVPASLLRLSLDVLPRSARTFNTYSISETHDACTIDVTDLCLDGRDACPVGYAMDGVQLRVLPEGQTDLASSGVGELFIGGRGLARGYLKRPDLDADRFVRWNGERYYATGDLAEVDGQGLTTIIGRNDSMVKIRGYTVYLSAIEETLRQHCDTSDAAVLAENEDEANKRLVAYVVRGPEAAWKVDGKSGTSKDLRALLERHLPLYMVPSHFMEVETLPINQQTGKLERKALPALRQRRPAVSQHTPLSQHATARERRRALRELWSEALEVDGDSLEDDWNFFDLGGHSLTGLELTLVSCIQSTLAKAGDVGQYLVGGLGPDKRFGIFVGDVQIAVDGSLQFGAALMHATAQLLFGEQTEPALHQVQPGGAGGCEVHMEAGPLGQPVADQRRLVGGVVVRDQVDVEVGGHLGLDGIEEFAELHGPVPLVATTNHLAGPGVQGGEQRSGAVTQVIHVIMGAPFHLSRAHGQ